MPKYKVKVTRDLCIGAGSCESLAPKAFKLDPGGKVMLENKEGNSVLESNFEELNESSEHIINASKGCPVNAIVIMGS